MRSCTVRDRCDQRRRLGKTEEEEEEQKEKIEKIKVQIKGKR